MPLHFNFKTFSIKFLLVVGIVIHSVGCSSYSEEEKALLFDFIPHNSNFIIETSSVEKFQQLISQQDWVATNKDANLIASLKETFHFINHFPTNQIGILNLSPIGNKSLVPTYLTYVNDDTFKKLENNTTVSVAEKITYDGIEILCLKVDEHTFYAAVIQQVGMISPSKLMIENIIRQRKNEWESTPILTRLQKTASSSSPTLYINAKSLHPFYADWFSHKNFLMLENFLGWSAYDIKIKENSIQLVGVNLYEEGANAKMQLLKNQAPDVSSITKYTPLLSLGVETYLINDLAAFENQKEKLNYPKNDKKWNYLFEGIDEVSKIYFEDYDLISFRYLTPATFSEAVETYQKKYKNFRDHPIFELEETGFLKSFAPLIASSSHRYFTQIDKHFFFAVSPEHLESLWINVAANSTWHQKTSLQSSLKEVSAKSNALLFLFTESAQPYLTQLSAKPSAIKEISNTHYDVVLLHLKNEKDYCYSSIVFKGTKEATDKTSLSHLGRIQSKNKISNAPQFFTNWRTKQRDVVYQDEHFVLHLTDTKGNEIWSKPLDGAIVGAIQEIDIYKNTRIQMTFATQNKVYLIDKEGNDVKPFPLDFKDMITQELSVFDYDNNGKYRFVVTQGNELLMFDKEGKTVSGFKVPKTASKIAQPLHHIRLDKKDYLMLQEENGNLMVLDRTGKERIKIEDNKQFSGQKWFAYDNGFVSTTKEAKLAQIDTKGKLSKSDKGVQTNHFIIANERLLVLLSENKLLINEIEVKLDYGLYLPPKIITHQDKSYVAVVDQQANRVYLFDEYGKLLEGFPVFGKSLIDLYFINLDEFYMITKGEENSILIYKQ